MFSIQLRKDHRAGPHPGNEIFFAHLDRALDSFGTTFKSVVYFNFCQDYKMSREDIATHPDLFLRTIDKLFGVSSGCVKSIIEKKVREATPVDMGQCDTSELLSKVYRYCEANSK